MIRNCSVGLGVAVKVLNSYNDSIRDGMVFLFCQARIIELSEENHKLKIGTPAKPAVKAFRKK